jgi:hypothetical protein
MNAGKRRSLKTSGKYFAQGLNWMVSILCLLPAVQGKWSHRK